VRRVDLARLLNQEQAGHGRRRVGLILVGLQGQVRDQRHRVGIHPLEAGGGRRERNGERRRMRLLETALRRQLVQELQLLEAVAGAGPVDRWRPACRALLLNRYARPADRGGRRRGIRRRSPATARHGRQRQQHEPGFRSNRHAAASFPGKGGSLSAAAARFNHKEKGDGGHALVKDPTRDSAAQA
jgi:hypothetical protein